MLEDHPRICGEKLLYSGTHRPSLRITPAYAGKRSWSTKKWPIGRDHPRVCGEKLIALISTPSVVGSPPRMRGKASGVPPCSCSPGITPAYAGKRARGIQPQQGKQDHPRVCGEKRRSYGKLRRPLGSPPRMRGKAIHHPCCTLLLGITPAYAGKSRTALCTPAQTWDHPRVCGEKPLKDELCKRYWGSPPRMRGKGRLHEVLGNSVGITPAYAGKSTSPCRFHRVQRDHPRVCGEKTLLVGIPKNLTGSPPRMRGKD